MDLPYESSKLIRNLYFYSDQNPCYVMLSAVTIIETYVPRRHLCLYTPLNKYTRFRI